MSGDLDPIILVLGRCDMSITKQCPAAWVMVWGNIPHNQHLAGVDLVLWGWKLIKFGGPYLRKEIHKCSVIVDERTLAHCYYPEPIAYFKISSWGYMLRVLTNV